jgi:hypothetical protein
MGTTCDLLLGLPLPPHTPVVQDTAEANAQRQWQQAQLQFARSRLRNAVGGVENREEFLLKFVDNNGSYGGAGRPDAAYRKGQRPRQPTEAAARGSADCTTKKNVTQLRHSDLCGPDAGRRLRPCVCSDGAAADGGDLLLEELIGASCVLALVARASPWHAIALAAVVTDMACALHTCRCE